MLGLCLTLAACNTAPYAGPDRVWTLKTLNDMPFAATATLTFPKMGEINGEGPCNSYFGALNGSYPEFEAGPIGSTRRACPEHTAEAAFFEALQTVTVATVEGRTLVLSGAGAGAGAGAVELVFTADG